MKHATLRQLKVFEAVARHLSFSRAAAELHLTQPAVSTQIKTLEGHAGLVLFEQLGKKVYLTPGCCTTAAPSSSSSRRPRMR
jgi:DNA-binding transcriptional LysR family regulator